MYILKNAIFLLTLTSIVESINYNHLYEKLTITRPKCLPLRSKSISANPYHLSLLSIPGTDVRRSKGIPIKIAIIDCPHDSSSPCVISSGKSFSYSISDSYSISLGNSKSFQFNIGTGNSSGVSNAITKSIGKSFDKSLSQSITDTNKETISKTVSHSLQNSQEISSGVTNSVSNENSETNSINDN